MADDAFDSATADNPFNQVPIEITISVGRARPLVRDLLRMRPDSVLPLDKRVEDPVELYVGDRLIARGELEELEGEAAGQLAVRLTEVADLKNGLLTGPKMSTLTARTATTIRAIGAPRLLLVSLRRMSLSVTLRAVAIALALALFAGAAQAQQLTLDLGDQGSLAARSIQLILLVTVLSLVPGLAIMVTCFPFIVTVLSILRQGLGLQQSPPNMLIVSLALFLTYFVMEPVFTEAWSVGVQPLIDGSIDTVQAFRLASQPFHAFMLDRVDPETFASLADLRPEPPAFGEDAPLSVLVPSFLLSEISRAFQIGFLIFLPFLIIDLVVAAVLMSMGMMMVPPAIVSLPFKLAFFVVADGWTLISSALVRSYF